MIIIPSAGMEFFSSASFSFLHVNFLFSFFSFLFPVLQFYAAGPTGVIIFEWVEAKTTASAN